MSRTSKKQFLDTYEAEHAITMKVLRAFPADKADLKPHPKCNTAKQLAWTFVLERRLGTGIMSDAFANGIPQGSKPPEPPEKWEELLSTLEKAHKEFGGLVNTFSDEELEEEVTFMVGPKQLGKMTRNTALWFLLHDQIHHRGQFSIYLRIADAKVPSIYGPSADEPWT